MFVQAARQAGLKRIVHLSTTDPSTDSPLGYFRGKAAVEKLIADSGLAYTIVRPTVIFGTEEILINNVAWLLRRFPVFAIPGSGDYRLQPVFVEDVAELAVDGSKTGTNTLFDAVGPEIYTFQDLVEIIAKTVGSRAKLVQAPAPVALLMSRLVGLFVGDVVLTKDEVRGLMGGLLVSSSGPTGRTQLSEWLSRHADRLGLRYASELSRHFRQSGERR